MIEAKLLSAENRSLVFIEKGGDGVLVAIHNTRCLIVSTTHTIQSNVPFIPYAYDGNTSTDTYETFLHLIGKMALKAPDSKYFSNPKWDEHCKNGRPRGVRREAWERLAMETMKMFDTAAHMPAVSQVVTGDDLDGMTSEQVKVYVDSVDANTLQGVLEKCTFACIKRTYEKYFGFRPVSTEPKDRVISHFRQYKQTQHRNDILIGPCC